MNKEKSRLRVGLVGTMSDNFDGGKYEAYQRSVASVKAFCEAPDVAFAFYPDILLTTEDAVKAAAFFEHERVDFLLVQTTTFPGGEMILKLAKVARWLGLWALPETGYAGSNFVNSNNSFCGINMFASILKHYLTDRPHPNKWFFGAPDDERFARRLSLTLRALSTIKAMEHSRVAMVGGIAPGFNDLYFDERLIYKRLGVDVRRGHEFSEIQQRAYAYSDARAKELASEFVDGCRGSDVTDRHLEMAGRYYQAYTDFCADHEIDALAVSCWPQIKVDTLACSVIGKLNQNGIPASCEGDLPGAVSQLFLSKLAGGVPSTMMDMAGFDEADESVLMWHCGPTAACYAGEKGNCVRCSYQLNIQGEVLSYGVMNDLELKPQPVTFMRFTGEWDRFFLLDGRVIDGKTGPDGSRGWIGDMRWNRKPIGALDFVNSVLANGFEHHFPMMAGDQSGLVLEAMAWLGVKPLTPVGYEDYLQII